MIWPFRKRKASEPRQPDIKPINEDWQAGDLAECIAAGPWVDHNGPHRNGPESGDVLLVTGVHRPVEYHDGSCGYLLSFKPWPGDGFWCGNFRKVPPLNSACDTEFAAKIKKVTARAAAA